MLSSVSCGAMPSVCDSAAIASVHAAGAHRASARSRRAGRSLRAPRRGTSGRRPPSWRWRARGRARLSGSRAPSQQRRKRQLFQQLHLRGCRRARRSAPRRWLRTGTDAEAGCRRHGWSAPSGRPAFPARGRTAAAPAPAASPVARPGRPPIARSSASSSSVVQCAERVEHALRHVGGGRLGEGEAEDLFRRDAVEQKIDHALRQHVGLAGAGIGGHPRRNRPDLRPRPARRSTSGGMIGGVLIAAVRSSRHIMAIPEFRLRVRRWPTIPSPARDDRNRRSASVHIGCTSER